MAAPSIPNLLSLRGGGRGGRGGGRGGGSTSIGSRRHGHASADAVIQDTDTDAAVSRLSAVDLGYLDDPYARFFVSGPPTRRLPIINRGTYMRTQALDQIVATFLAETRGQGPRQIISLGAGTDTRPFRALEWPNTDDLIYHEIDFAETCRRKLHIVRSAPAMARQLEDVEAAEGGSWSARPAKGPSEYHCHAGDLRDMHDRFAAAGGMPASMRTDVPTLVLSECCLCYLTQRDSERVLGVFRERMPRLAVVIYEPMPLGDAFGQVMVSNLRARSISMPSLERYRDVAGQEGRLRDAGFDAVGHATIKDAWDQWVGGDERRRVDGLEGLDEVEEWQLLAAHYVVEDDRTRPSQTISTAADSGGVILRIAMLANVGLPLRSIDPSTSWSRGRSRARPQIRRFIVRRHSLMTCATLRRRSVTYRFVTSTNLNRFASSPSIPSLPSHYLRLRRFNFFFLASLSSTPYSISLVRSHASSKFLSRLIVISPIPTFGVSSEGATFVPGQDVGTPTATMADKDNKAYKYRQEISQVSESPIPLEISPPYVESNNTACTGPVPPISRRTRVQSLLAAAAAAQTNSPPAAGPRSCEPLAEHDLRPRAQDAAWSLLHTRSASRPFLSQPHNLGSLRSPSTGFISQPSALNLQQPQMPPTPLPSMDTNEQEARPPMLMPHPSARSQKNPRELMINTVRQMMYVSGETAEPSVETTSIIEDIVRQQVIELLRNCTELASRRGSKSISTNDLIFQIRHDQAKVSRLRTFLSWKDVRKNVKDSDDKGADADLAAGDDPVGGVVAGSGPVDEAAKKNKKAKVGLPWEPASFFPVEVPERDDEEDEEEDEMNYMTLQRLRKADERTKLMTREEYVTWSEYRQASFTWRKGKRFREWAGFGVVTDSKPSDDIVDILGFLTFEMVATLTEVALKAKEQEDLARAQSGADSVAGAKKRKHQHGLFDPPSEGKTPIEPRHVQEAFRRFQQRPKKSRAMLNGTRLIQHTPLNII
ncbi:Transcription initiation factor IID, 18kDa subunit [Purpureocillium lilacinum]|uniref:Leucine carboxyl methyltransferase 1 n=2 Tax=Purpureocillium lilacinum TaxID=33203 RepID=A0A2U3E8C4_PURLI|nr:hypothetical protein Purlil1_8122 [Purpureocillium lilacinum]PWI70724.1 Transcription initiation factor IID, 18kDa subunit [Purpureocillium lilacinum]